MDATVALERVGKWYGRRQLALREVSVGFEPGAVTAVAGANGSGKTTLLRILAGTAAPSRGAVRGLLVGTLAHLTSAVPAVLIGTLFSNPIVRRQGYALGGVLLCLLLTIPADDLRGVHQGLWRFVGHLLPPPLAIIRALGDTDSAGRAAALLRPDVLGAAAFAVLTGAAYLRLARSRS